MDPMGDQTSVLAKYLEGPALVEQALAGLQDADLDVSPSQGGWTIRQIVHHIVDGDDLWKACIKAALGNEQGEFRQLGLLAPPFGRVRGSAEGH
jgi:uncharacterized damage-inducible protein DinB